ncbi:putative myosin heavy chain [Trypanosoma cruzi]|nr:putative myosin heavy chain [Trypanosoma cruzi]
MDSPFQSGSKEKEKSSSSSTGDHHFPFFFPSLANDPNTWGSKVLFTQNCAAFSLSPTSRLNTSKRAHKKTTNSHGEKRKTIKDPTALVRRRENTLFAQVVVKSTRAKELQARANPDPIGGYCAPLRLFRQLLFHPKEEGWRNVILAAKSPCIGGQQNKSSHIAGVKWAAPPHFHVIIARLRTCVSSRTPSFLKKPFRRSPQMQWTLESNRPGLAIAVSLTNHLQ